jgi:enoyl-CoA hydratase
MIELSKDGPIARLVLNRPAARNALAIAHWEELADAAAQVARSDAQMLVVSGAGGAFSAGADLAEFPELQAGQAARLRFRTAMRAGIDALAALPMATLAWIDGPCFGAGVALAMAADLRVASPASRFAITPAKIGIGYPQEDVARLVSLVGPGRAARLLFTGDPVDAATAAQIGLIEAVAAQGECEAFIRTILACDPASIAMLKRGIGLARTGSVSDAGQDARFDDLFGSPLLADRLSQRRDGRVLPPRTA